MATCPAFSRSFSSSRPAVSFGSSTSSPAFSYSTSAFSYNSTNTLNTERAVAADSKVETISRLVQWRIEKVGTINIIKSEAFRVGIWNWRLSIEKGPLMYIRLFAEPSGAITDQPPIARFVLRIFNTGPNRKIYISPGKSWKNELEVSCPEASGSGSWHGSKLLGEL